MRKKGVIWGKLHIFRQIFNGWIHHDRRIISPQSDCKNFNFLLHNTNFNYRTTRWFSGNFPEISQKFPDTPHPTQTPSPLTPPPPGTSNPFCSIMCFPQITPFFSRRSSSLKNHSWFNTALGFALKITLQVAQTRTWYAY